MEINETEPLTTETQQTQSAVDQAGLGQEAFLRIFLAQLESQHLRIEALRAFQVGCRCPLG